MIPSNQPCSGHRFFMYTRLFRTWIWASKILRQTGQMLRVSSIKTESRSRTSLATCKSYDSPGGMPLIFSPEPIPGTFNALWTISFVIGLLSLHSVNSLGVLHKLGLRGKRHPTSLTFEAGFLGSRIVHLRVFHELALRFERSTARVTLVLLPK